ncbi:MAG: hypothetical protein GKR93_13905 [Gammaproteobacteria bacterium]|nr:hypothetical protein [Gammaproteobacteria bacterium]
MKLNKTILLTALLNLILAFTSLTANADDAGFTLDESIRKQVFLELTSNVKSLYRNSYLIVPDIDTATSARIAGRTDNIGFVLPLDQNAVYGKEEKKVDNIN